MSEQHEEGERKREVEQEIKHDLEQLKKDEERLEKDIEKLEEIERERYKLIVNREEKDWPERNIKGRQILELAGSPADWVVNQLVPGGGEDPEIDPDEPVDLALEAEPKGIKKFQTRKPKTNPGAVE